MNESQISENDFNLFSQPDPEMKTAIAELWDTAANMVSSMKSLREDNHNLKLKVSELEKLYVEIGEKEKLLNRIKELEALEKNLAYVQDDLAQKNHELNNKAKEILDLKNASSLLDSKIIELETGNQKLKEMIEKTGAEKAVPEDKDFMKLKLDNENYKFKSESQEKLLRDYESQLFDLKLKNSEIENSLKDTKDSEISKTEELSTLKFDNEKLKKKIEESLELSKNYDKLNESYIQLISKYDSLEKEIESGKAAENEFYFYKKQAESYQEQVKSANNELILKNNTINELRENLAGLEEEFNRKMSGEMKIKKELEAEISRLSSVQELQEENKKKLAGQIDNYLVRLDKILNQ